MKMAWRKRSALAAMKYRSASGVAAVPGCSAKSGEINDVMKAEESHRKRSKAIG